MRPNLFSYATSELSQDAILAWMLAWADSKCRVADAATHKLGLDFLRLMYKRHGEELGRGGHSVEIRRQQDHVDVLAVVDEKMAVLIEDKVGTEPHSDQLARYRRAIGKNFAQKRILAMYVQTYEQGSYKRVKKNKYEVIGRSDLLKLLARYVKAGGTNEIALDFSRHLLELDQRFGLYRTAPVEDWGWYGWQGFFVELQDRLKSGNWKHVSNAAGGFWGFWWEFEKGQDAYLQLEESQLCFKIDVPGDTDTDVRRTRRSDWHRRVVNAGAALGLPTQKPTRFGNGQTMTVAVMRGNYVSFDKKGALDWAKMVTTYRLARRVLRRAAESAP